MSKPSIQDVIVDSTIQALNGLNIGKDEGAPRQRRPYRQQRRNTNARKAGNPLEEKSPTTNTSKSVTASASATIIESSPNGSAGGAGPGGAVNIHDGEFNAVAGSHFTVNNLTINNASGEVLPSNKGRNFRNKGQRGKNAKQNRGLVVNISTFSRP
ncbi:hypothetical protein CPC08DRAFT_91391, partial [Agrocybe pediades]